MYVIFFAICTYLQKDTKAVNFMRALLIPVRLLCVGWAGDVTIECCEYVAFDIEIIAS